MFQNYNPYYLKTYLVHCNSFTLQPVARYYQLISNQYFNDIIENPWKSPNKGSENYQLQAAVYPLLCSYTSYEPEFNSKKLSFTLDAILFHQKAPDFSHQNQVPRVATSGWQKEPGTRRSHFSLL